MQQNTQAGERRTDTITAEPSVDYVFPTIQPDDFGGWHLDKATQILWIGVNVSPKAQDYEGAWAFLLSMKHVLWQYYAQVSREIQLRRQLAAKPPERPAQTLKLGK